MSEEKSCRSGQLALADYYQPRTQFNKRFIYKCMRQGNEIILSTS